LRNKRNLIVAAAAAAALLLVALVLLLKRGPSPEELLAVRPEGELVDFVDNLSASSTAPPITDADGFEIDFDVDNLYDESRDSAWRTEGDGVGERINLVFDEPIRVTSLGLLPGWALFENGVGPLLRKPPGPRGRIRVLGWVDHHPGVRGAACST
jgi:hypothetical protein